MASTSIHDKPRTVNSESLHVRRYRPRIEGSICPHRTLDESNRPEDIFWRSISKDNITTWYGKDAKQPYLSIPPITRRIFSWLICQSYDDKGNVIVYEL